MRQTSTAQKGKDLKGPTNTSSTVSTDKKDTYCKNCGDANKTRSASTAITSHGTRLEMAPKLASSENSERLKFGSKLSDSILELKNTLAGKFDQLEKTLIQPSVWGQDADEQDVISDSGTDNEATGSRVIADEPPAKKARLTTAPEAASKQNVLSTIAERMQAQENVDPNVDEQLLQIINQLMFKQETADEEKLKEKLSHIIRPANCTSLVTTKVDELIWQTTAANPIFSRAQVAQTCVVKSVTMMAKMLDKDVTFET